MDQVSKFFKSRFSAGTVLLVVAGIALTAVSLLAPDALAQTIDATKEAPGATVTTPGAEAIDQIEGTWQGYVKVAIVLALFIVPIFVGSWLAKALRMPEHGWKFAIAIGTIAAAAVVVSTGEVKLGPDLSGGITLIYELAEDTSTGAPGETTSDEPAADDKATDEKGAKTDADKDAFERDAEEGQGASDDASGGTSRSDKVAQLIGILAKRIDPTGTKEISIRKWGEGQIEIIIPKATDQELAYIERRISTAGVLVFRITASPKFKKHQPIIDIAEKLPAGQNIITLSSGGESREVARWVEIDEKEFPTIEEAQGRGLVTRMSGKTKQALVMTDDGLDVTGEDIKMVTPDVDEKGAPQVSFAFNATGAFKFGRLTGEHVPTATGQRYNLGILLDNRLLSAPTIESQINDRGRISGNMTEEDVTFLAGILKAGALPASLNKVPISRAQISPTLGALTIEKGKLALTISLALVAVFMVFYYRQAGVIACVGLAVNMLLIVGCMVLIKAAFTLPGLAGLVLTVGMSVDANVLIYERIREELKRGAALRMAIRNGFDRATTTIIDSNVTNLITGIVIYKIAPDNVKGFGVTLVLGIAMSIFVAVFLTRIAFDVVERKGWVKSLHMMQFIGETKMDFLGWRRVCIAGSLVVIGIGLLAVGARRGDLFDIDFTGGSSVQFVLKQDEAKDYDEVFATLEKPFEGKNLSLVEVGNTHTHYSVTTVNDDIADVQKIITEAFAGELETYQVEVTDAAAIAPTGDVGLLPTRARLRAFGDLPLPLSYLTLLQAAPAEDSKADEAEPREDASDAEADDAKAEGDDAEAKAEADTTEAVEPAGDAVSADDAEASNEAKADASDGGAAAASDSADPAEEVVNPFASGGTSATIKFSTPKQAGTGMDGMSSGVSYDALQQLLLEAIKTEGFEDVAFEISNPDYQSGSARNFEEWQVKLALPQADAEKVLGRIEGDMDSQAIFPLSNKIGGRVASRMATDAIAAIVLCLAGIIGYVWFRFHGVIYGIAAVVALVHDVLISLGFVALSAYLVYGAEPIANALLIDKFQVSLTLVAAFLTIIGYSLNDTIVIFDRIREVKGKSPRLTPAMINLAVNQCFARTLLTSFTSLISVFVLYIAGGEGIHAFAFALLVGFVAGVYSTIYIANPVLMWLSERAEKAASKAAGAKAA
jgi:SecD/SecF fusion protein